jgi:M6 family metalloprotease-like protein
MLFRISANNKIFSLILLKVVNLMRKVILTIMLLLFILAPSVFSAFSFTYTDTKEPKAIKILPILLEFSDYPRMRTEQEMWDMFFGIDPSIPSLCNYFLEVTDGRYEFVPGEYGVGSWIRMPKRKQDYAKAATLEELMTDMMNILQAQGTSLKEYDQDNDGFIDHLLLIQSGDPIRMQNTIFWLHKWTIRSSIGYDGVRIKDYTLSAEVFQADKLAPLHGICHEFCHDLGAWDLYDYDYDSKYAVGPWDIMADNRSNFGLSGFSRYYLNWLDPIEITESGTYTIDALCSQGENRLYRVQLPGTKEYFIIENRYPIGVDGWWKGIPDNGLVIYHIDGTIPIEHRFNDGPPRFKNFAVWVEDAGNITGKVDAAFSLEDTQTAFTPYTTPNSRDYNDKSKPSIFITEISSSGPSMTFKIELIYEEPWLEVKPSKLSFGELEKGKQKTLSFLIQNKGTSTLRSEISSDYNWIKLSQTLVFSNEIVLEVTVDTSHMTLGSNQGYIEVSSNGGNRKIIVEVDVIRKFGDLNGDNRVDDLDWAVFRRAYGSKKGDSNFQASADFNKDELVNIEDFMIFARNYAP